MFDYKSILLIFLGSLLTFITTFLVEYFKNKIDIVNKKKNFIIFTRLELSSMAKSFDKLKSGLEYRSWFEIRTLNLIHKSLTNLESARHEAVYLDLIKQERFIDLLTDISTYINDVEGLENLYSEQINLVPQPNLKSSKRKKNKITSDKTSYFKNLTSLNDHFNKQRVTKSIDLVDIKRKLDDFIRELTFKN